MPAKGIFIDFGYYESLVRSLEKDMKRHAKFEIEGLHYENVMERVLSIYNNVFNLEGDLKVGCLHFDTPRMYEISLAKLFVMMNQSVPGFDGIAFKEYVFTAIENDELPKGSDKDHLFLENYFKFKFSYILIETFYEFRSLNFDGLSRERIFFIGKLFGAALGGLSCLCDFSVENHVLDYHKIGQGLIRKLVAEKNDPDYRDAVIIAVKLWREGEVCDHIEMAKYLIGKENFCHLKEEKLRKKLVDHAKAYGRARGMKGFKKIDDDE